MQAHSFNNLGKRILLDVSPNDWTFPLTIKFKACS